MTDCDGTILPLFIHTSPVAGESLMSLLVRASEANVLGRVAHLQAVAGTAKARIDYLPFTGFEDGPVFAGLLGVDPDEVAGRMHPAWPHNSGEEFIDWYGTPLPRRYVEARTMRFSPTSLAMERHHHALWSIKPIKYCSRSMDILVSECGACCRPASWTMTKSTTLCAGCDHPLSMTATTSVASDLQADARHVANLVNPDPAIRADALNMLPAPFCSWEAGDAFHAAVELGFISNNPIQVSGDLRWKSMSAGGFQDYYVDDLVQGYRFMREWPHSFEVHVTRLVKDRIGNQRALMGSMGKYFDTKSLRTRLGDLIRSEVPKVLRKISMPIRGNQVGGRMLPRSPGTLTANEIAQTFKIDKKLVARLSFSPTCCIAKSSNRRGVVLYDQDSVDRAIKIWRSSLTSEQVARALGVPPYCVDAIAEEGLLENVDCSDATLLSEGRRLVSKASLENLVDQLEGRAISHTASSTPFWTAMVNVLHPRSWATAVRMLLVGEVPITGICAQTGPLLKRFLVAEEAFAELKTYDERLCLPDVAVSGLVAADMLGVSNTLVSGAVRLGLVLGTKTSTQIKVPLSEVRRYRQEVIGSDEVTKKTGTRSQDFSAFMRSHGFEPLGRVYNTYFWRRADAETIYRVNSTET